MYIGIEPQKVELQQSKEDLTKTPALALHNTERETIVSADASSYGLGAVIRQKQPGGYFKPVAYASRSLIAVERRYTPR